MKVLVYDTLQSEGVYSEKRMPWSEANEKTAKQEARNGVYEIINAGMEEPLEPTRLDRIEAQSAYTAMMTDTLLEA